MAQLLSRGAKYYLSDDISKPGTFLKALDAVDVDVQYPGDVEFCLDSLGNPRQWCQDTEAQIGTDFPS